MRLLAFFGTRPEAVKLATVIPALRAAGHQVDLVATGQQSDPAMAAALFAEVGLQPDVTWTLSGDAHDRYGQLVTLASREVENRRPDAVFVMGDTSTVPAALLAARRHGVGAIHLEAGLRSFNDVSLEEGHRRVAAGLATCHLAPTALAAEFLRREGIPDDRVHVVGNSAMDVLRVGGWSPLPVAERSGTLVTAHRATNVDDPDRLRELVSIVGHLADTYGDVTFPVHPRTLDRLTSLGLAGAVRRSGVTMTDPVPHARLLAVMRRSRLVVTDSGGLQEEAAWFGVPVVVMRRSTPRWEGVQAGSTVLTGVSLERVTAAAARLQQPDELERIAGLDCPYGDGHTARRVCEVLDGVGAAAAWRPVEPDFLDRLPLLPAR